MKLVGLLALAALGCESGTMRSIDLTVPSSVSGSFTEAARGVVLFQPMGEPSAYVVLCGQTLPNPLPLSQDLGFGCLGARVGMAESLRAWVQPMPQGWSELPCSTSRSFYEPIGSVTRDGGAGFAATPRRRGRRRAARRTGSATSRRAVARSGPLSPSRCPERPTLAVVFVHRGRGGWILHLMTTTAPQSRPSPPGTLFRGLLWLSLAALFVSLPAALSGGWNGLVATFVEFPLVLVAIPLTMAAASAEPARLTQRFTEGALVFAAHVAVVLVALSRSRG
ncbi:MAG: hypothetical protein JNJ54_33470 [Myxococcaceae bacterium]|nr:hypothetical protein [Myxococcaceae bacterium]